MAAIDTATAPLVLRHPDGREQLIAACFPHPAGLLYLDLYWHQSTPAEAAHLLTGRLSGAGPWRIGDARLRVKVGHAELRGQAIDKAANWSAPSTAARLAALYEACSRQLLKRPGWTGNRPDRPPGGDHSG